MQAELEENRAADPTEIVALMTDLERFINDDSLYAADALVKMALIHHQFESIHPFYDGNGRTGRIVCVLYLVKQHLLDIPAGGHGVRWMTCS